MSGQAVILALSIAIIFVTKTAVAFVPTRYGGLRPEASFRKKTFSKKYMVAEDAPNKNDNDRGSPLFDISSLNSRLEEVKQKEQKLPLVVLDSMLPRQVLEIQINNALLIELVRNCLARESPYIGMLGIARLASGQQVHMTRGVEVEILEDRLHFLPEGKGLKMALRATERRFQIEEGSIQTVGGDRGYTEAKVKFLDSKKEEKDEVKSARRKNSDDNSDVYDRTSVARAVMKAEKFMIPNGNMPNNLSLVDRWIELAKEKERTLGQIDQILEDLGEIPPFDEPSERAFWVGALINPLPGMGVALEIRPALLTAKNAEQRVEIALNGILRSIKYMDGSSGLMSVNSSNF